MKDDERQLLTAIFAKSYEQTVRDVINNTPIPPKRAWYLLEKWSRKGWYDWGVTIDMGWLTETGKRQALQGDTPLRFQLNWHI